MIRTNYDPEADVLYVRFGPEEAPGDSAQEVAPGVYIEFDPAGHPIGIEITSACKRSSDAKTTAAAAD